MLKIEDVKKNEFFKQKENAKKIYQKGNYSKINKAWECVNFADISDFIYLKKGKQVFINFEF